MTTLLADTNGVLWIGTLQEGLYRYADGRFDHYTIADGLPGAHVMSIAPGIDHDLWIGTDSGLVQFKTPRIRGYTGRDGLAGDQAANLFQDRDGSVWAESGSRVTRFVHGAFTQPDRRDGMPEGRVGLIRSATTFPLIYSNAGLLRWTSDRFVPVPGVAGLPWDRVAAALDDRSGTLWLAIHDGGLLRVRDGQVTHLTRQDGMADDAVAALFEDRAGNLWVGTFTNGMTRISGGRMTFWSMRDGLPSNFVKAFHEDAAGRMWIGTHGGGLSRFKDGHFATISVRQGLYNDVMFQILEDDDGNFWMNCNTGIWRTSVQELNDVATPPDDGFNPHGISIDEAHNLMVTSDFICPLRTLHVHGGDMAQVRGSVRVWHFADRAITRTIAVGSASTPAGTMEVQLIPHDRRLRAFTAGMIDGKLYEIDTQEGTATPVFDFSIFSIGTVPAMPQLLRLNRAGRTTCA